MSTSRRDILERCASTAVRNVAGLGSPGAIRSALFYVPSHRSGICDTGARQGPFYIQGRYGNASTYQTEYGQPRMAGVD